MTGEGETSETLFLVLICSWSVCEAQKEKPYVRPGAVSPDRALCLPTFSHFVIVNKASQTVSHMVSLNYRFSMFNCIPPGKDEELLLFVLTMRLSHQISRASPAAGSVALASCEHPWSDPCFACVWARVCVCVYVCVYDLCVPVFLCSCYFLIGTRRL